MARYSIIFIIAFIFIFNVICINGYEYEGRLIRNTRQRERIHSKPRLPVELERELEDSYGDIITSRPKYYEGGNQWKPMFEQYEQPPQRPPTKYRSKSSHPPKYQQENVLYPSDHYPKSSQTQQYSATNFIANQTLYVSDSARPSKPVQKKTKHIESYLKKYVPQQQYQVHEDIDDSDDSPYYEEIQNSNRFRHQDIVMGKPKPSGQYPQYPVIKEKHIHHVHYPNGEEEILSEPTNGNIYRYSTNTERRPERRPYTRNSRYSASYSSSKRPY